MPKVCLDLEKLKRPNSGLGKFCHHLSRAIAQKLHPNELCLYLPESTANLFPDNKKIIYRNIHKFTGVNADTNIWHSMHQEAVYFPKQNDYKLVVTIHDLNFLKKYKGIKQKKQLQKLQKLVNRADAVVFISKFTQKIANENLNLSPTLIQKVIYNGVAVETSQKAKRPEFIVDSKQPFLFTLGIVGEKKNFHTLIEMMKHLPLLNLYISGNKDTAYAKEIEKSIHQHRLAHRIVLTGEITEQEKIWLYKNCSAFVFPSLTEGFGLPVVEAMSYGKPLIISNKTSLPEIGGKLAHYFPDFTPEKMAQTVIQALHSHTIDKSYQLIERSKQFSWEQAAEEYIRLYHSLL